MTIDCYSPLIELEIQEVYEGNGGSSAVEAEDYEALRNKPSINGVTLQGDKSFNDLKMSPLTNTEILAIINKAME